MKSLKNLNNEKEKLFLNGGSKQQKQNEINDASILRCCISQDTNKFASLERRRTFLEKCF